jgi:tetratricopeptide (TPR) repeat protein
MIENFTRDSLSNVDNISIEKTVLLVNMMGTVYRGLAQNFSKAQEFHELALDISQRYNLTTERATSLHLLGIIHTYQRNLDTAREYHEEAVQLGRKIFSPNNNGRLAAFLLNFGVVCNRLGNLERAKLLYLESLELTKKEYGARDQRVGRVLNCLSTNYYASGLYSESVDALLEALRIHEEIHGDYHPNVAQTLYILGFSYRAKGELENSIQVLSRSLQIWRQYYGEEHYHVAEVLHDLSNTQRELNLLDDALHNAEKCIEIFRKDKKNRAALGTALNGLGNVYLAQHKPNEAKMKFQKALEIFQKLQEHGSQAISISETFENIAMALKDLNEKEKAKEFISLGLSEILKVYPETHPRVKKMRKLSEELTAIDDENVVEPRKEF